MKTWVSEPFNKVLKKDPIVGYRLTIFDNTLKAFNKSESDAWMVYIVLKNGQNIQNDLNCLCPSH